MKLPFLQVKPQRRAVALQLFSTPRITKSSFINDGVDLNISAIVHYSDRTESRPLQVPTIILTADKVRQMYAMVTPKSTEARSSDTATQQPAKFRKVCKNGHRKNYAGGCEVCDYLWREAQKDKAKRRAARVEKA